MNFSKTTSASLNLNQIDLFVFDLDGTLMDSGNTIYLSTLKTFELLGYNYTLPKEELDKRIGAHFQDIFNDLGIFIEDIEGYINAYKKVYFDFIDESTVYDGVTDLLQFLKSRKKRVGLLTTKAQEQADRILAHFGLEEYFDVISGRTAGSPVKPSPIPLLAICDKLQVNPANTIMIGDTEYDVDCGRNAGTFTCGIVGYRSEEQLSSYKPDFLIHNMRELIAKF